MLQVIPDNLMKDAADGPWINILVYRTNGQIPIMVFGSLPGFVNIGVQPIFGS